MSNTTQTTETPNTPGAAVMGYKLHKAMLDFASRLTGSPDPVARDAAYRFVQELKAIEKK